MKELSWVTTKTCCNRSRNGAKLLEGTQKERNHQTALFWKGRIDEGERHIITHAEITIDHERTLLDYQDSLQSITKRRHTTGRDAKKEESTNSTTILEGTDRRR